MAISITDIKAQVAAGFSNVPEGILENIDLVSYPGNGTYDTATDTISFDTTTYEVEDALLVNFTEKESEGSIVTPADIKCIIQDSYLNGYEPTTNDKVNSSTKSYEILTVQGVPGNIIWTLGLREIK